MILELETNRKGNTFLKSRMDQYCFIYLVYTALIQEKEFTSDIHSFVSSLKLSYDIKNILNNYLKSFPKYCDASDFERYSIIRINRYFSSFRVENLILNNEMYTRTPMCRLVSDLLDLEADDKLADFYGAPENFLIKLERFRSINFQTMPVCFSEDKTVRDFFILINDVLFAKEKQIDIRVGNVFNLEEKIKFNKIYAFLPVFRNTTRLDSRHYFQNIISGEDKSIDYINNVINHLDKNGRAVICISDILVSSKSEKIRKKICESGCFRGFIKFPAGEIDPSNLSSFLLVFDKSASSDKIVFLDLCDLADPNSRVSIIDRIETNTIKDLFNKGVQDNFKNLVIRKEYTSEELKNRKYNFDTKEVFDLEAYLETYDPESEVWDAPYNTDNLNLITLKETADISRGIQDTENIRSFQTDNQNAPYLYLGASDISEGKLNFDTMIKLSDKKANWEKYFLHKRDIIITKTAYPAFKVAIFEGVKDADGNLKDVEIIPASNLYVIRMKPGESSKLNPYYLKLYLESDMGLKYLHSAVSGSRLPSISKENLENLTLPEKTVEEQDKIETEYKKLQRRIQEHLKAIEYLKKQIQSLI